jgi:hypothetical protein
MCCFPSKHLSCHTLYIEMVCEIKISHFVRSQILTLNVATNYVHIHCSCHILCPLPHLSLQTINPLQWKIINNIWQHLQFVPFHHCNLKHISRSIWSMLTRKSHLSLLQLKNNYRIFLMDLMWNQMEIHSSSLYLCVVLLIYSDIHV